MLEFHAFYGFRAFLLLEKLKICRKIEKIHAFNAKQWTILYCTTGTLGVWKQVCCWAYGKTTKRDAL